MKLDGNLPAEILAKLITLEETAEHLADQVKRSSESIANGRARLQNGAAGLQQREHDDLLVSVRQAIDEFPKLQSKSENAQNVVRSCKDWIASLPEGTQLVLHEVHVDGQDLTSVRVRIRNLKEEMERLRKVPTASADIEARVREYVSSLGRPKVEGIQTGATLSVSWPASGATLAAFLDPDAMVAAVMGEVRRMENDPMPPPEREKRLASLVHEIRELTYVQELLIEQSAEYVERSDIHAPAILCAAIVRDDDADNKKKVALERRERTSA